MDSQNKTYEGGPTSFPLLYFAQYTLVVVLGWILNREDINKRFSVTHHLRSTLESSLQRVPACVKLVVHRYVAQGARNNERHVVKIPMKNY